MLSASMKIVQRCYLRLHGRMSSALSLTLRIRRIVSNVEIIDLWTVAALHMQFMKMFESKYHIGNDLGITCTYE